MKRFIALFLSALMLLFVFSACGNDAEEVSTPEAESKVVDNSVEESKTDLKTVIRIAGMKGPTSIGLVGVMENNGQDPNGNEYEFTLAGAADEITPKLIKGDLDIAAVPTNLAVTLYNKTNGKIKILALNTLSVLYVLEKGNTINFQAETLNPL